MKTEEQRLLRGELNPQERADLRKGEYWETCFNAWLDSGRPSAIREWLAGPTESFLRWMDAQAWALAQAVEMRQEDEVEVLKALFPMWETPDMPDEEIEAETELTAQEAQSARDRFL